MLDVGNLGATSGQPRGKLGATLGQPRGNLITEILDVESYRRT